MATVVKNFRIKSGLIVEGTSGTIGGHNILTESTSGDQYILNLVGGATLVKSVGANLSVDGAGELSLDLAGIANDVAGTRLYTDGSTINVDVEGIYDDMVDSGIATVTNVNNAIDTAATDATNKANAALSDAQSFATTAANNAKAEAATDATTKANNAKSEAITAAALDATSKADAALADAQEYADSKIDDSTAGSSNAWSAYKTYTEIGLAQTNAQAFATQAIADLVDSAPATLDTLNELAEALQDNPDIISDLQSVASGKQNILTPGANISIANDTISVTGLDSEDISNFAAAALAATASAYDAAGSASDAQEEAESYANNLVDDLTAGITAFTEINVNSEAKQIAATSSSLGSVVVTAYEWPKADYRSGKFLVKIDNGQNNEISEILVTLDSSDNVAITEYAIVGTNGSRGTITASVSGANVQLRVDPVNDSTIKVTGTLLK
jgi:hypothetical protein